MESPANQMSTYLRVPLYTQYRTLDKTIQIKQKDANTIQLSIYTIAQERVFRQNMTLPDGKIPTLEELIENEQIPQEHLFPKDQAEETLQAIEGHIQNLKPKIDQQDSEIEQFTCSITREIFQDPVMDDHGHTFERAAIEEYLKMAHVTCPLSREPINSLTPNLAIRQHIAELKQKDPIPTWKKTAKENPRLAQRNIDLAKDYAEEEEYEEALKGYAKALQFTNDYSVYAHIPELYKKTQDPKKALLATLYYATYQLQDGHLTEAIQTLEAIREIDQNYPLALLLIQLYRDNEQIFEAIEIAQTRIDNQTASPEERKKLYLELINLDPQMLVGDSATTNYYESLASLTEDPEHKIHYLLKGAIQAIESNDSMTAQTLISLLPQIPQMKSLLNQTPKLCLHQDDPKAMANILQALITHYTQSQSYKELLKVQKMQHPNDNQAIAKTYQKLGQPQKARLYSQRQLNQYLESQNWPQAEQLALKLIKDDPISCYQTLETIYTNWKPEKLSDLYTKLGQAQLKANQLAQAEATYQKAYARFNTLEHALSLAETLKKLNKTCQAVRTYYEASSLALVNDRTAILTSCCIEEIQQIDPAMQHLKASQRINLLVHNKLVKQEEKIVEQESVIAKQQTTLLEQQTVNLSLSTRLRKLEELEESKQLKKAKAKQLQAAGAFGKLEWSTYFGEIGQQPPLPVGIHQILASPCPFWPGKKVQETHLLVLVPQTVNGQPLTLQLLSELIQKPEQGHATQFRGWYPGGHENTPTGGSHWVLMTKEVIPGSCQKSYPDQLQLLQECSQRVGGSCEAPHLLDAAVCLLMHHARTGERLCSESSYTFTRCQETYLNKPWQMVIGGFAAGGPMFFNDYYCNNEFCGLASFWKF